MRHPWKMKALGLFSVAALLAAGIAAAETVTYRNTSADTAAGRARGQGQQIAVADPANSAALNLGPLDLAGCDTVLVAIENTGAATSGACAAYMVKDGDDVATTTGKIAFGNTFTITTGAASFAASVGPGIGTGYNVALPRRLFVACAANTNADLRATVHCH